MTAPRSFLRDLPRKQLLLLSLAILLPSVLLVFLGARTVFQERELAEKRLLDRQRALADDIGRGLLIELRRVALEEANAFSNRRPGSSADSLALGATALVARIDSGRVVLPWDDEAVARFTRASAEPPFASEIARGQRLELVEKRFAEAAAAYQAAADRTSDQALKTWSELLIARALAASGSDEAWPRFERVLQSSLALRDDQGVPFALYAARRLTDREADRPRVSRFVRANEARLLSARTLSPVACSLLAELPGADVNRVRRRCDELAHASALAGNPTVLTMLRLSGEGSARAESWVSIDSARWLVGVTAVRSGTSPLLVGVRRDSVMAMLARAADVGVQMVSSDEIGAVPVGNGISGLALEWTQQSDLAGGWDRRTVFMIAALILLMLAGVLGAYLVWRDMRREVHLAELRSQFVASVSHELKTPLTAIRMFAETLRDRPEIPSRQRAEYLDTIITESERLTRLLQNVLDFSRTERGERAYRMMPCDLGDIVRSAVRTLQYPLAQDQFTLELLCESSLPLVWCDSDAVEQAVLNLLTNAMKYAGADKRIVVSVARVGDTAVIAVRDFGEGIAPEHRARVFEKFYRAPTPENETVPGTGLGLALVEHVASGHGAVATVASAPGKGSIFELRFPLANSGEAVQARKPQAAVEVTAQ